MDLTTNKPKAFKTGENTKTIAYKYGDLEIVEICEIQTGKLIGRKQREKSLSGTTNPWEWTYGAPQDNLTQKSLIESTQNPVFMRFDTETHYQWLVQYIPFPADTYEVTVNENKNQIIIKTTNKKYFKVIDAPEFVQLETKLLAWAWSKNTLIIRYPKTKEEIDKEKEDQKYRMSIPFEEDADPGCRT